MSEPRSFPTDAERFGWLERPSDDFPYYRGSPVEITTGGWLIVLAGVSLGFILLVLGPGFVSGGSSRFLLAFLFWAIPLAALALVTGGNWTALFRRPRGVDFLWMIGLAVMNIAVTLVTGSLITSLTDASANTAVTGAGHMETSRALHFFAMTGIQLIGEEVTSILPFLAALYWLCGRGGLDRKAAIIIATLIVALLFAIEHGPTYDWNPIQLLLGVGIARVVLLLPYIMTKSLVVSAGAHILNDWTFFALSVLSAASIPTN